MLSVKMHENVHPVRQLKSATPAVPPCLNHFLNIDKVGKILKTFVPGPAMWEDRTTNTRKGPPVDH